MGADIFRRNKKDFLDGVPDRMFDSGVDAGLLLLCVDENVLFSGLLQLKEKLIISASYEYVVAKSEQ